MNQKRSIILFTLLVFFLIYVEKTHGCHPSGSLSREDYDCTPGWDGVEITDVTWDPNSPEMTITVYIPDGNDGKNAPQAYGHFRFTSGGDSNVYELINKQKFVNTHKCAEKGSNEVNPYTSSYTYDELYRPLNGETFRIWISVYWSCIYPDLGGSVLCCHRDMVYTNTVKY
ncbi:hypothetical protein C1645_832036 [Glomus cerebriforme]|uniref:Reelin domain-containing protein n=1 Tax=Glomus cerebriforme TaxID=658196 RepID=A0A397SIA0_9GLOM|nr:hypothetical protein C1645_832036 [Glomus cerebriforme]